MERVSKKIFFLILIMAFLLCAFFILPVSAANDTWNPSSGSYKISTVNDLKNFRNSVKADVTYEGKLITLEQDITIADEEDIGMMIGYFQGRFNGNGCKIIGFNDPKSGLFNVLGDKAIVSNVELNMKVKDAVGTYGGKYPQTHYYGGIANQSVGLVNQCIVTGEIKSAKNFTADGIVPSFAGIVSRGNTLVPTDISIPDGLLNTHQVQISDCAVLLNIEVLSGKAKQTTANGVAVSRDNYKAKPIRNCYFSGQLTAEKTSPIVLGDEQSGLFYNASINNSASLKPGIATSKTESEMQQKKTYVDGGWDFEKIWTIDEGKSFPTLQTDLPLGEFTDHEEKIVDVVAHIADKKVLDDGSIVDLIPDGNGGFIEEPANYLRAKVSFTFTGEGIDEAFIQENELYVDAYNRDKDVDFRPQTQENMNMSGEMSWTTPNASDGSYNVKVKGNDACNDKYIFKTRSCTYENPNFYPNSRTSFTGDKDEYLEKADRASQMVMEKVQITDTIDATWAVYSDARAGYFSGKTRGDEYFKAIKDQVEAENANFDQLKITDWEKLVLAVTSLGYDARDITYKGKNLIEIISNKEELEKSNQHMAVVTALLALDSYNYVIPEGDEYITRDALKAKLVTLADAVRPTDLTQDVDHIAMYAQGLAPYYKKGDVALDAAVGKVITYLGNVQAYSGGYGGYGTINNVWSASQALITLGVFNVDPLSTTDNALVKCGNTIYDAVFGRFDFEKNTYDFGLDTTYDNHQVVRGFNAVKRSLTEGATGFFDCTDVTNSTILINNEMTKLPAADTITKENLEQAKTALAAIDTKLAILNATQKASMNMSQYDAVKAKVATYDVIAGDANGDGIVTLEDATAIQKYLAKVEGVEINEMAADVSHADGVNLEDATLIQKYLAKVEGIELTLK